MTEPKLIVENALSDLLGKRDIDAVDTHISPNYIQHSGSVADGPDGVRDFLLNIPDEFDYEIVRVLADRDLVVTHGVFHGVAPEPMVAFSLFRIENDQLDEQWDAATPLVSSTVSGRGQLDGPTVVTDRDRTDENRSLVREFMARVLVGGEYLAMAQYLAGDTYHQHNPVIADGMSGMRAFLAENARHGIMMEYHRLHRVVAEGQFVFTQSEGTFDGCPHAFYDLFRIEDAKIAEHWDVMAALPAALPHDNESF
ncbi:nuclear transport factor 2 family protein [Nocardia sp. FBN12]|uniref:nuclear transport factor 2 family protein n=1 Tax=Nocardia sp. FBN12 TaxID=3419766 RepID=UPI003CFDB44F